MQAIKTIVVAHDFSEHAAAALEVANELATRLDAHLHLLHVVQPPSFAYAAGELPVSPISTLHLRSEAEQRLNEIAGKLSAEQSIVSVHVVEGTNIADTLDEKAADLEADMIVMGTHGRTGLAHVLHGSVAERTLRRSPCPVLTVPLPAHAREARQEAERHARQPTQPGVPW